MPLNAKKDKKNIKKSKKTLAFLKNVWYNDCRLKYGISSATISRKEQVLRRSLKWQNVVSAVRALCSVKTFLTLIAKPTELGSPTSAR